MNLSNKDWNRFWEKVDKRGDCWLWMYNCDTSGYGQFRLNRRLWKAHILSFLVAGGILLPGQLVLHECDVPRCVKPEHLFPGTHRDNARDRDSKGRGILPYQIGASARKVDEHLTELLKAEYATGQYSQRSLAEKHSLTQGTIWKALHR